MANIVYEVRQFGLTTWYDISDRVVSTPELSEGPDTSSLGTGIHRPRATTIDINLNNKDYFFTRSTGTRRLAEPGAVLRITINDETWFIGKLAARRGVDDLALQTEWAGNLWALTSGALGASNRLYISKTPGEIFDAMAEVQGIQSAEVLADAGGTPITRILSPGVDGLADLVDAADVSIYNNREGQAVMELPGTRAARMVSRFYTDRDDIRPNEKPIAQPIDLEDAFGVINYAEAQVVIYSPDSSDFQTRTYDIPESEFVVARLYDGHVCITWDIDGLISDVATAGYDLTFRYENLEANITQPDDDVTLSGLADNDDRINIRITNLEIIKEGTILGIAFDYSGTIRASDVGQIPGFVSVDGTVTIANGTAEDPGPPVVPATGHSLDYNVKEFTYRAVDASSIVRFGGIRPREKRVVIGIVLDVPVPDTFTPNQESVDLLKAAAKREIEQFRSPIPVFEVEHADEGDILARRLGDVEHLRLNNGIDEEFYVEAMQTSLNAPEQLTQKVWYVARNRTRRPFIPAARYNTPGGGLRLHDDNQSPRGCWSDGTTMWVADGDGHMFAYTLPSGPRDQSKEWTPGGSPRGCWSDGTTMWVCVHGNPARMRAYDLVTHARDQSKEWNLSGSNRNPGDFWSDGETVLVPDWMDGRIYSYRLGMAGSSVAASVGGDPEVLYVANGVLWVIDNDSSLTNDARARAYDPEDYSRISELDIDLHDSDYTAIWGNDTLLYAVDWDFKTVRAYNIAE